MSSNAGQKPSKTITPEQMQKLPKVLLHEHADCSPRLETLLSHWSQRGFDTVSPELQFPQEVIEKWSASRSALAASHSSNLSDCAKTLTTSADLLKQQAIEHYRQYLLPFAASSLGNYVKCVVQHILPVMQTRDELTRIFRERIEDAVSDGLVALELRFAPQLHTWEGLTLDEVMDTVVTAIQDAPIPVYLTLCALRQENAAMARRLGDLCVKYKEQVGCYDLAADEAEPGQEGVLDWWVTEAARARELRAATGYPLVIKCHLWETNDPTAEDVEKLQRYGIKILGHGIHGNLQDGYVLEINPTSNVVIGQVKNYEDHPIDRLYRQGKKVTLNTDGLTLTGLTGLTEECLKMQQYFGWGLKDFHAVFTTALEASNFPAEVKSGIQRQLDAAYQGK